LLSRGHRAWREGVADVQAGVDRDSASLSDAQLAERCAAAGAPWGKGMTRSEAVSALAFMTWDAAPAAMAYTELEERAHTSGCACWARKWCRPVWRRAGQQTTPFGIIEHVALVRVRAPPC
jgi:hypothetical protein